MAQPSKVEIRAYQVGFGDCFLVSFVYARFKRHVLIDFGTTQLPGRGKGAPTPKTWMPVVANHIKQTCGGKLTAVVATHRHADHISGFATDGASGGAGKIIAACKPDVVLQPWTEDPAAAKNAKTATRDTNRSRKSFVASLEAMHSLAAHAWDLARNPPPSMTAAAAKQLSFLGMDNIKNKSAVNNLREMGDRRGARAVWAHHGSESYLTGSGLLEGVKVHVLGPPTLEQTDEIRSMRSKDPDEFWQLLGGRRSVQSMKVAAIGPDGNKRVPPEARWFRDRIARLSADQLLQIVRTLDDQMNNTSVILLFEVGGKKLLFPGDAQVENWSWALEDSPDHEKTRQLLAGVDFYKVGHHGSRNATPKMLLWENFAKRNKPVKERMKTALSTLPGKHGTPAKHTEVPRKTLLDALQKETSLVSTEGYKPAAGQDPCLLTTVEL